MEWAVFVIDDASFNILLLQHPTSSYRLAVKKKYIPCIIRHNSSIRESSEYWLNNLIKILLILFKTFFSIIDDLI